jgi:diguanylate cyclase (GGDEF)-like protein
MKSPCYGESKQLVGECMNPASKLKALGHQACDGCLGRLEKLAFTDLMTGLPNRLALQTEFPRLLERGVPLGAIMTDIQNFKQVNERLGHRIGDKMLIYTARFLASHIRRDDEAADALFVARRGGDEFALITQLLKREGKKVVPLTEREDQMAAGDAVMERLASTFVDDAIISRYNRHIAPEKPLGLRMGFALASEVDSLEALLDVADIKGQDFHPDPQPVWADEGELINSQLNHVLKLSA